MTSRPRARALTAALTAIGLTLVGGALTATSSSAATTTSTTSTTESTRVDRVKSTIDWFDCSAVVGPRSDCGTIQLPVDYDQPTGAKTEVSLLRVRVADPKKKVGTLFINPGGPGGSGVDIAANASAFLSPALLAKFDIVGFDPRGTNFSDNVKCFKNLGEQATALSGLNTAFPYGTKATTAYVSSAEKFGKACSTTGKPLSASMSTAEVARDMDVLRRTLGDKKLTYLGFSYGTYLGNVYANLFPDRVRALVIDGVLDPVAWAGTTSTASIPQTQRLRSGEGADKALQEILRRCDQAGKDYCNLATTGDPQLQYAKLVAAVKKKPILLFSDPDYGDEYLDYPTLVSWLLGDLYAPDAGTYVDWDLSGMVSLTQPATTVKAKAAQVAARKALQARYDAKQAAATKAGAPSVKLAKKLGFGFPYDNSPEAFQSVLCTDGLNPAKASSWTSAAAYAENSAPGFGPLWTWASAPCASSTWTARDEDAYAGAFTHTTSAPVLVVGSFWDPATNYQGAVKAASLLPSSRLLSSDNWGHTAYGTSACATNAIDAYLTSVKLPSAGKVCKGDSQPFTTKLEDQGSDDAALKLQRLAPQQPVSPIVAPLPGDLPRY
ncbi:alpha/beta fold hydrolase [Cellulomonas sp. JH27-2]|uniref:alpha/beta fold hydrolase n=1 Tax=Cellulomonas sp. JH27-2 TaxID=2774139 RepID=UPI00178269ED|nr:alpha/beta fold hydrolase [Cellulomonas sp. JH27-2]